MRKPTVGISMGDPGGIGAEIIVRALADGELRRTGRWVVLGSSSAMHDAAGACGIEPFWWRTDARNGLAGASAHDVVLLDWDPAAEEEAGENILRFERGPSRAGGELSFRWVDEAIRRAKLPEGDAERVDAIATGPISKEAWAKAGRSRWPGHTELLAERFGAKRVAMMFDGPALRVVLATVHLPLMDVRNVLTIGRVFDSIDLGAQALAASGVVNGRIAVCGLNPHAGEGGLLGDEETRLIEPAIELAVRQGIDVSGPYPADTVFGRAVGGEFDLVVAMYHDQGLIPVKLLARDRTVNVTLGLPTVRTSPDHGTAFDIAGRGVAEEGSMRNTLRLAVRMTERRAPSTEPDGVDRGQPSDA